MTKRRSTKRALLSSVVALLLCFSMLLGSTFAWFTDSAVSGSNVITAGNLDIEVQYSLDGESWYDLDGATDLFWKGLWEPGHTEVVLLKITNNGSLALKYAANMNIVNETVGKTKDDADIVLSEILTVSTCTQQYTDGNGKVASGADIFPAMTFNGADGADGWIGYQTTSTFKAGNVLKNDKQLQPKESDYIAVKVDMAETVGNEANHNGADIPEITFGINVLATQFTYEEDSFGNQYDKDAVYPVGSINELNEAINNAVDGDIIQFSSDLEGNIEIPQKKDVKFTIDGNGNDLAGVILVDGKSGTYTTAGVTIKNVNFVADSISADACIQLGNGTNATRYTCNVTVEGCTFDVPGAVGIKSYTGGDKNLVIRDCTATARAHSLAQLKGIDGVRVEDCTVNSVRGINFNNSDNIVVENCTIDVQKYGVRFGESANTTVENYGIIDSTITSDNGDGDAAIVLRAGATNANLTLTNTKINADINMSGHENANVVIN